MTAAEIEREFDKARAMGRILIIHKLPGSNRDALYRADPKADCRNTPGAIVIEDEIDLVVFLSGQHRSAGERLCGDKR